MNGYLLAATLIYPTIAFLFWQEVHWIGLIFFGFFAAHLLALGLLALGKPRAAYVFAFVAGIAFFPLGMFGILGMRQIGDEAVAREFEQG